MPTYDIEFSYKLPEWGSVTLQADDKEQAELFAREYVIDSFEDVVDLSIDEINEVK
jgi:hypothetical protein